MSNTLKALVRTKVKKGSGVDKAYAEIVDHLSKHESEFREIAWELIRAAIWYAVRNRLKQLASGTPTEKIEQLSGKEAADKFRSGVQRSLASAEECTDWCSMHFVLPNGVRLGSAGAKELRDACLIFERRAERALNMVSWLRLISNKLTRGENVEQALTQRELKSLAKQVGLH